MAHLALVFVFIHMYALCPLRSTWSYASRSKFGSSVDSYMHCAVQFRIPWSLFGRPTRLLTVFSVGHWARWCPLAGWMAATSGGCKLLLFACRSVSTFFLTQLF